MKAVLRGFLYQLAQTATESEVVYMHTLVFFAGLSHRIIHMGSSVLRTLPLSDKETLYGYRSLATGAAAAHYATNDAVFSE